MVSQFSRDLSFKRFYVIYFFLRSSETIRKLRTQIIDMFITLSICFKLIYINSHLSWSNVLIHNDIFSFLDLWIKLIERSFERTLWIAHLRLHQVVNLNDWVEILFVLLDWVRELLTIFKYSLLIYRSFLCS